MDWKLFSHSPFDCYVPIYHLRWDFWTNWKTLNVVEKLEYLWSRFSFKCPIPKQKDFLSWSRESVAIWVWLNGTKIVYLRYFWLSYFMRNRVYLNLSDKWYPNLLLLVHIEIFPLYGVIFLTLVLSDGSNHIKCLHPIFIINTQKFQV